MHFLSFAAISLTGGRFHTLRPTSSSSRSPLALGSTVLAGACLVAAAQDGHLWLQHSRSHFDAIKYWRPKLHVLTVDALSGAIGEVLAVGLLYPLDTLKVRCQAGGLGTRAAVQELLASGSLRKNILPQLYAGVGSAALCSAVIGAVHLLVFYAAKRAHSSANGTPPGAMSLAGIAASLSSSILEVPIENWRVRAQAGALSRPIWNDMVSAFTHGGLGALYWSYGAFLLKSVPHDVAELVTFAQLKDWKDSNQNINSASWLHDRTSEVLFGAAAGVAAAVASMPCDVIKTRMDVTGAGAGGPAAALRAFFITGRAIIASGGGPHALFVGIVPKLLQTVPSAVVYWCIVEAARRSLSTFVVE